MHVRLIVALALMALHAVAQESSPVMVDGRTLWSYSLPRAGFPASMRAAETRASFIELGEDTRWKLEHARDIHLDGDSILLVGRIYLFGITDEDARLAGKSRIELFSEYKQIAFETVKRYRESRSLTRIVRSSVLAVGALVGGFLALAVLLAAYRRSRAWQDSALSRVAGAQQVGALVRELEIPISVVAHLVLRIAFLSVGGLIGLVSVSYALGLFPQTAGLSTLARDSAMEVLHASGANLVAYLPNLFVLLVVVAFTYSVIKIAKAIARAVASGAFAVSGFHREWAGPTYRLVRFVLILFGLVVAFPYLPGGDSPALRGVSIFVGVLVSLGSGSAMGNAIAGIILTYMRPYQLGDRVKIADSIGDVTEKSLLVTRLKTIKNVEVILPNNAILGAHIINYSAMARNHGLILSTTITIGYDAPWQKVRDLLIGAALKTPGILAEPKPFVFHTSLNDFHVSYEINAYTQEPNQMDVIYSELRTNIQQEFNDAGIEIMSPTYLAVRDGNTTTIPESQRLPDYSAPAFRVKTARAAASEASPASTKQHQHGADGA